MGNQLVNKYRGHLDHETVAEVSVMVYFTPNFCFSFPHPIRHIRRIFMHANQVYLFAII